MSDSHLTKNVSVANPKRVRLDSLDQLTTAATTEESQTTEVVNAA